MDVSDITYSHITEDGSYQVIWALISLEYEHATLNEHTLPQNTEIFGILGSKYQIITRLGHQDENRPYKVSKYLFKWFFLQKHM